LIELHSEERATHWSGTAASPGCPAISTFAEGIAHSQRSALSNAQVLPFHLAAHLLAENDREDSLSNIAELRDALYCLLVSPPKAIVHPDLHGASVGQKSGS